MTKRRGRRRWISTKIMSGVYAHAGIDALYSCWDAHSHILQSVGISLHTGHSSTHRGQLPTSLRAGPYCRQSCRIPRHQRRTQPSRQAAKQPPHAARRATAPCRPPRHPRYWWKRRTRRHRARQSLHKRTSRSSSAARDRSGSRPSLSLDQTHLQQSVSESVVTEIHENRMIQWLNSNPPNTNAEPSMPAHAA